MNPIQPRVLTAPPHPELAISVWRNDQTLRRSILSGNFNNNYTLNALDNRHVRHRQEHLTGPALGAVNVNPHLRLFVIAKLCEVDHFAPKELVVLGESSLRHNLDVQAFLVSLLVYSGE